MNWSNKQETIYDTWETTLFNLAIEAAPGSGKTTTLLELLKRAPAYKKSIFLAFNRSIKEELEKKVPFGTETSTLHSLGFRVLMRNTTNKYKVNEIKNWVLGKKVLDLSEFKDRKKESIYLFTISKLVDLYRLNLCETEDDLIQVADKYGIDILNGEIKDAFKLIDYLKAYNNLDHDKPMMIDYVDMLYLPIVLVNESKFPKYDVVMIDESQDLNSIQWELVKRLFKKRSRFVSVGDPFQSIYSFQGADKEVFNMIKNHPNTKVLPLSYSYRCGTKIVEEANKVFNFIESPEGQHEGEVIRKGDLSDIKAGDFVLCRNNQPLIETFLKLLKDGKKAYIMGRDYGKGLLNVLNKIEDFSKESINDLLLKKEEGLKEKGIQNPKNHNSYIALMEKINILSYLHSCFDSIQQLKQIIEDMFSDDEQKDAITLSTIHKSKGLESSTVYFLQRELIPSQYATTPLDYYSEKCLLYVGITRSINKLIYVS